MKRIRKAYSGVVPSGKVLNTKSDSNIDTYSSKYINDTILTKHTYSSDEIVVGEWFGKPLYRKVLNIPKIPISSTSSTAVDFSTGANTDIKIFDGYAKVKTSNFMYKLGATGGVDNLFIRKAGPNVITLVTRTAFSAEVEISEGYLIVDYIKTTD